MNPLLMQMWIEAFGVALAAERRIHSTGDAEQDGYRAAQYAEQAVAGAQRAAAEAREAGKVVKL